MKFNFLQRLSLLGNFWQNKSHGKIFRWNLLLIILTLAYLVLNFDSLPPVVPFFFSLPWGEAQLASSSHLFVLPILSFLLFILNHFLAALLIARNRLFPTLLIIFSLVFSLFSLISVFQIINLSL